MAEKPLISVILPVYNAESYLAESLDSLLNQSYQELEILAVNDGSTDQSLAILEAYAKADARLRVISQKNRGQGSARNQGLDEAQGAYISFVDSDDLLAPQYFEALLSALVESQADFSTSAYEKFKETKPDFSRIGKPARELFTGDEAERRFYAGDRVPFYIMPWGKLFKADIFEGLRFPEGRFVEDEFIAPYFLDRADRIVYLGEKLYFYRENDAGTMASYSLANVKDAFEMFEGRMAFLQDRSKTRFVEQTRDQYATYCLSLRVDYSKQAEIAELADQKFRELFKEKQGFRTKIRWMGRVYLLNQGLFIGLMKLAKRFGI
ncbi:glycosyltransferase family 2 protein [Lactococcus termiticola]|uniref:Glycosyl transferase n=1 Tax=Lactococcus termiticola TaxID=2169526 RepID=A0A2R5HHD2_9LACT|nr:glycosyltransferase family 2 protein [Lactococcus termiticola]GBG97256.1 glycosyl transferase [Lactococcus termiticola]